MSEKGGSFRPVCQFCFDLTPVAAAAVGVGSQLLIAPKTLVEAVAPVVPIRRFSVPDSCSSVSKKTSYFCEKKLLFVSASTNRCVPFNSFGFKVVLTRKIISIQAFSSSRCAAKYDVKVEPTLKQ